MASSHEILFGCTKLKKEKFSDIKHNLILICCGKLSDICDIYNKNSKKISNIRKNVIFHKSPNTCRNI